MPVLDQDAGPQALTDAPAAGRRTPRALVAVWWLLGLLVVVEAVHELFSVGGPDALFDTWIHGFAIAVAAALCFARAIHERRRRGAWLWFGAGLACWAAGDVLWQILYGGAGDPPYPTVADALWLAWYPLTVVAVVLLMRDRVERFELHRWMDGLAVMLVVLTATAAVVLQPVAERTDDSGLAVVVDFAYPVLDVLLIGAILGVFGLLAWRPGRSWLVLGAGCVVMALADGLFSVQQARGTLIDGDYAFLWVAGAVLIAVAAWSSTPAPGSHGAIYGWRAIALAVAAQLLAAGIQTYGIFHELGRSERIVTLVVLIVATVQIVISRPRAPVEGERGS
jgi:hypothetical protein